MTVQEVISDLISLKDQDSPHLERIAHYDLLLASLRELDELIEMEEAKETVCEQLMYLIVNPDKNNANGNDSMLNAVITGPPGVGKTKLARILAKIWNAMGLINKPKEDIDYDTIIPIMVSNRIFEAHILNITEKYKSLQQFIVDIQGKTNTLDDTVATMIQQLERLRMAGRFINMKQEKCIDGAIQLLSDYIENVKVKCDEFSTKLPVIDSNSSGKETKINVKDVPFQVVTREDFVAGYLGQTAIKTKALLEKNIGKVLFIDEAYLLYNGGSGTNDTFGMEALTTLNEFMSRHAGEIIVIFAGYQELMDDTIFKAQPGLKRRCLWSFDIKGYTSTGLANIFRYQLHNGGWDVHDDVDLNQFFEENKQNFTEFGGDTEKLTYHCRLAYSRDRYQRLIGNINVDFNNTITNDMLRTAFQKFLQHSRSKDNSIYKNMMYS